MNEKKKKFLTNGAKRKGPERTSFYTADCQLNEYQKYLHRANGSQLFGYKRPLRREAWLVDVND
ncbi:MAG: hypothetical protein JEZ00_21235 [Anaerolineaceae bacterium]|nr:hypothetical protein [Anaerolineaceae bacterium]